MGPEQIPLSDEELAWVAANAPDRINDLNSDERRRLSRLQGQSELGPPDASLTTRVRDAGARFLAPIVQAPFDAIQFGINAVTDTSGTLDSIVGASREQLDRGRQAQVEGRPMEATLRTAAAFPLIGPAVADVADTALSGDVAGAAGKATVLAATPTGVRAARTGLTRGTSAAIAGARKVPGVAGALDRAAGALDATAEGKFARSIAPQVGPNKTRYGRIAERNAGDLLRDPALQSKSVGGFDNKLDEAFSATADQLDEAADARLVSQQVKTRPILAKLDQEIARLQADPVEGSRMIPEIVDGERRGRPIGQTVEPQPNAAQLATLRQIRKEIAALGDVAPYESVRRIRQAWDQVAKIEYMPSTAADALKSKGDATGAAKGTSAMREALAETDPRSASVYEKYSLYKATRDVRKAALDAERTRPNRGRGMVRTLAASQGIVGTAVAIADKAAEMAPSFQVMVSRRLAAVADLLRQNKPVEAQAIIDRTVSQFPAARKGWQAVKKGSGVAERVIERGPVPMAAENQAEEP